MSYEESKKAIGFQGQHANEKGNVFFPDPANSAVLIALQAECGRAQRFTEDAIAELRAEAGDVRLFAAANLDQAVGLYLSLEGEDALLRTLDRLARMPRPQIP